MMSFSGSQSEPIKNGERQLDRIKTHLGRNPKVCSVCTIACSQAMLAADAARARRSPQPRARRSPQPRARRRARSLAPVAELATQCSTQLRGALVNTSVYLKPAKLLNVALDMLARLAPCLNLGVREFGHKDLLDTIDTDNRRK